MSLRYTTSEGGSTPCYNGNLSEWEWQQGSNPSLMYGFTYDDLNRLTESVEKQKSGTSWTTLATACQEKGISYDYNGNLKTLTRTTNGTDKNLIYNYTGNQLTGLSGDLSGNYTYDANGNMLTDSRRALNFEYNFLNLVNRVTSGSSLKAAYTWLADGAKLRVRDGGNTNGFDYLGSLTYWQDNGGLQLETADFGGGVIRPTINGGQEIYYFLRDHLGSVRAIVDESGEAIERNDYYPFGSHRTVAGSGATANRFKYNGKEVQTTGELGYLDYGARMYDAELGRWFNTDLLAEKYYSLSSYIYCANNPVVFVDPNGNEVIRNNAGDITITGDDLIGYWGNLKLVLEGKTPYENFLESIEKAADSDRHRFLNLSQDIDVIEQYIPQEGYRWKENFPLVYYTANNDLLVVSKATNKYVSILNKQLEYDFEVQYKKQNNIKTKYWSPVSDIRLLSALLSGYASAVNPNPLSLLPPNSFMRDIGDGWQVADRMLKQKRFQYYKKFDIIY